MAQLPITLGDSKQKRASYPKLGQIGFQRVTRSRTLARPRARTDEAFMQGVLAIPAFLQAATAQEILSIKCVSKFWATWYTDNINTIAHARCQDTSADWYFPLLDKVEVPAGIWQMSGMWHGDAEYSSQSKLHKLPWTDYMQPASTLNTCICHYSWKKMKHFFGPLMASGGGLLLFKTGADGSQGGHIDHSTECVHYNGKRSSNHLMVTNPLTKQCRDLPTFQGGLGSADMSLYFKHHHFITVDDEANAYKVLIFSCSQLDVYNSRSNYWHSFGDIFSGVQPSPGGWSTTAPKERIYSAACVGRRLYVADVRQATHMETCLHPDAIGAIRLFEVDIETCESKMCNQILVCTMYNLSVDLRPVHPLSFLRNLELVESMGQLYAIIPARLDQLLYEPEPGPQWMDVTNSNPMPLQFYIFRLNGDDGTNGVIRIEVPESKRTTLRLNSLFRKTLPIPEPRLTPRNNWFACTAEGRVIWVTFHDYLVCYDLMSRECKTEFVDRPEGTETVIGLAYRASFHMKP